MLYFVAIRKGMITFVGTCASGYGINCAFRLVYEKPIFLDFHVEIRDVFITKKSKGITAKNFLIFVSQ